MKNQVITVVCVDQFGDIQIDTFAADSDGVKAAEACFLDHVTDLAEDDDDTDMDDPETVEALLDDGVYQPTGSLPLVAMQWS